MANDAVSVAHVPIDGDRGRGGRNRRATCGRSRLDRIPDVWRDREPKWHSNDLGLVRWWAEGECWGGRLELPIGGQRERGCRRLSGRLPDDLADDRHQGPAFGVDGSG